MYFHSGFSVQLVWFGLAGLGVFNLIQIQPLGYMVIR